MAHSSNFQPYPLPFPNEDQRISISSYSSLANALGLGPGYTDRQGLRPLPLSCDTVIDKRAIYLDAPPVSNPSYPYPARNVFNPATHSARSPLSAPNGRRTRTEGVAWGESNDRIDLPKLSPWFNRLPQLMEPDVARGYQAETEFPTIHFQRKGDKLPYTLLELLTMDTMPDLVAGDVPILIQSPDRWIKIKLIWPGYSRYPFEKRVAIKRSVPLTSTLLLMALAYQIYGFVRCIQSEDAAIEPGQEHWAITGVKEGVPAVWKNCVITSLQHVTGSIWQPEIYCLRG